MNIISFDTETRGLDWWDPDHRAFLIAYADADGEYIAREGDTPALERFFDLARNADILIAHNLPFDVHMIRETWGVDLLSVRAELWDTEIMARVVLPRGQQGSPAAYRLKALGRMLLSDDAGDEEEAIAAMAKAIGLRTLRQTGAYHEVWRAYPDAMENYARQDVRLTYDLWDLMSDRLVSAPHLRRVMRLECAVAPILIRAEQRGIAVDRDRVRELLRQEQAKAEAARAELEAAGIPAGGEGSEAELVEALQRHGVPLYRTTRTGQLSTDRFALAEFRDQYPVIETLLRYRASEKLISTYLGPMQDREVIHTSFQSIGAWSGRMSSRRPNMQNVPRGELRSVLVPRPGYAFVVADFDAIEMRLLAYYVGSHEYRRLVAESDPHAWMASKIHGGSPADYAKGGPNDDRRSAAKNSLFAICYGAGAPRITDMNGLDKGGRYTAGDWAVRNGYKRVGDWRYEPARRLIASIKDSIPGFQRLQDRIRQKIEREGHVRTLWGRVQPVNPDKAYVGLNALIQGSAADIMKQALINAADVLQDFDAHVLLVVHDEIVVEVKEDQAERARDVLVRAMTDAYDLDPPLEVTSSITTAHYGAA